MITATSQAAGVFGAVEPHNAGTATLSRQGVYTGTIDRTFRILITQDTAGDEQFIYSDDGGVTWSGALPALALTWITLTHGLQIMFIPGPDAPQAVLGDEWWIRGIRPWGVANLLDLNRDNECRTGAIGSGAGYQWQIDLGSPRTPAGLIVYDHNFPAGSGITLLASTTSNFAVLNVNQAIPWAAGKIRHIISGVHTYRYWALAVTSSASVPYLRASELYLGDVITMGQEWNIGYGDETFNTGESPESVLIRGQGTYGFVPRRLQLEFAARKAGTLEDIGKLDTLFDLCHHATFLSQRPFFLFFDSVATLTIFELVNWVGGRPKRHRFLDRLDVSAEFLSLVRTAAA